MDEPQAKILVTAGLAGNEPHSVRITPLAQR
jgi:hypothetical protein